MPKQITKTVIAYACERPGCAFSSEDFYVVQKHEFKEHTPKPLMKVIGQQKYYYCDTESTFIAWVNYLMLKQDYDFNKTKWSGENWYGFFGEFNFHNSNLTELHCRTLQDDLSDALADESIQ